MNTPRKTPQELVQEFEEIRQRDSVKTGNKTSLLLSRSENPELTQVMREVAKKSGGKIRHRPISASSVSLLSKMVKTSPTQKTSSDVVVETSQNTYEVMSSADQYKDLVDNLFAFLGKDENPKTETPNNILVEAKKYKNFDLNSSHIDNQGFKDLLSALFLYREGKIDLNIDEIKNNGKKDFVRVVLEKWEDLFNEYSVLFAIKG